MPHAGSEIGRAPPFALSVFAGKNTGGHRRPAHHAEPESIGHGPLVVPRQAPAPPESDPYVQRQLGHASIQPTVDTYGKWLPMGNKAAVNRLDDETGRKTSQK
jgi:hypothetical protein